MSRAEGSLLKRICSKADTLTHAQAFLHTAKLKTGPGTGYDLGEGAPGLPAICAYIASEELGNADVAEKVAQNASCLKPKVFSQTLKTVRAALTASASESKKEKQDISSVTYEMLMEENKLVRRKQFALACFSHLEKILVASGKLSEEYLLPSGRDVIKVAVFCWVCTKVLRTPFVVVSKILPEFDISEREYKRLAAIMDSVCKEAASDLRAQVDKLTQDVKANRKASAKSSSRKPSEKQAPETPTRAARSALREMSLGVGSEAGTPTHKRKVAFAPVLEGDADLLETPSKKQRVLPPAITLSTSLTAFPAKPTRPSTRSSTLTERFHAVSGSAEEDNPDEVAEDQHDASASVPADAVSRPREVSISSKPNIFPSTVASSSQTTLELLNHREEGHAKSAVSSTTPAAMETVTQGQSPLLAQLYTLADTERSPTPTALAPPTPKSVRSHTDASAPVYVPLPPPSAGPSTPRRRPPHLRAFPTPSSTGSVTPASQPRGTSRRRASNLRLDEDEEEAREAQSLARFRPVFWDQAQWWTRDPRVEQWEREWRILAEVRQQVVMM